MLDTREIFADMPWGTWHDGISKTHLSDRFTLRNTEDCILSNKYIASVRDENFHNGHNNRIFSCYVGFDTMSDNTGCVVCKTTSDLVLREYMATFKDGYEERHYYDVCEIVCDTCIHESSIHNISARSRYQYVSVSKIFHSSHLSTFSGTLSQIEDAADDRLYRVLSESFTATPYSNMLPFEIKDIILNLVWHNI